MFLFIEKRFVIRQTFFFRHVDTFYVDFVSVFVLLKSLCFCNLTCFMSIMSIFLLTLQGNKKYSISIALYIYREK